MTTRTAGKLGLLPVDRTSPRLMLRDYLKPDLPPPPASADWTVAIPDKGWSYLGNDQYGDCFWAGEAHLGMLWSANASSMVRYRTADILVDYAKATGFDPTKTDPFTGENPTDGGTEPLAGLNWIRKHGLAGRKLLSAFVALDEGDDDEIKRGIELFGAVGVGVELPPSAMQQFNQGKPWTMVGDDPEGGHWIILGAYDVKHLRAITWGQEQVLTWDWWRRYRQCAFAMFGPDWITPKGTTPSGLNLKALGADLRAIGE